MSITEEITADQVLAIVSPETLAQRDADVLSLMGSGYSISDVAAILELHPNTVHAIVAKDQRSAAMAAPRVTGDTAELRALDLKIRDCLVEITMRGIDDTRTRRLMLFTMQRLKALGL